MSIDLSNGGNLKGQTFVDEVIQDVHGTPENPIVITNGTVVRARLLNCSHIILTGLSILGDDTGAPVQSLTSMALRMENSHHIKVVKNDITQAQFGIIFKGVTDGLIDANHIHHFRTDAMRGVNCHRVTASRNDVHDWMPVLTTNAQGRVVNKDHCDSFQSWNDALGGKPSEDITIIDNCFHRGGGREFQGPFFRFYSTAGRSGYTRLKISWNLIIGAQLNGIVAAWGDGEVVGNSIYAFKGADEYLTKIEAAAGFIVKDNSAPNYKLDGVSYTKQAPAGNILNSPIDPSEEAKLVAEWKARVLGGAGPVVPPPAPTPSPPPSPAPSPTDEDDDTPVPAPDDDDLPPVEDDDTPIPAQIITEEDVAKIMNLIADALQRLQEVGDILNKAIRPQ